MANLPTIPDLKVPDDLLSLPSLPKLDAACACGLNPNIEKLNSIRKAAEDKLSNLTSGGITGSLSSLASTLKSSLSDVADGFNKNLLSDTPKIGIKLQDEFHNVMNYFSSGDQFSALSKLQDIKKQFPQFDIQKALNGAAGILPTGAIPPNATELIKGDLTKVLSSLGSAIPKITTLDKNLSIGATDLLSSAKTTVSGALENLTSGFGTTIDLKGAMKFANSAVKSAQSELSKLGGAFNSISPTVDSALKSLVSSGNNLMTGVSKVPKFDICNAVPNLQVVNGVVKEIPTPTIKPTLDSAEPESPTPAPTPVTPVLVDKYSFPFWTESIKDSFLDTIAPFVDGKRSPISDRIPLDTSWPAAFSAASKILDTMRIGRQEQSDKKNKSVEEMQREIKMFESTNAALQYLNSRGRFYNHRVKNNLIDRLE
jgi:hypothetical protein